MPGQERGRKRKADKESRKFRKAGKEGGGKEEG
jgi:hypothetical protein